MTPPTSHHPQCHPPPLQGVCFFGRDHLHTVRFHTIHTLQKITTPFYGRIIR